MDIKLPHNFFFEETLDQNALDNRVRLATKSLDRNVVRGERVMRMVLRSKTDLQNTYILELKDFREIFPKEQSHFKTITCCLT